jgi:hypothetical protein
VVGVGQEARGGDDAFGLIIDENKHHNGLAFFDATLLLGDGEEEVFAKAPI